MRSQSKSSTGEKIDMDGPPDYAEQMLMVQIPKSEIFDDPPNYAEDAGPITGTEKKSNWFKRRVSESKSKKGGTVPIRMTRTEFLAYFAKDEKTGQYKDGVVEPPGGRKEWLQKRLPKNDPEQWDTQLRVGRQMQANPTGAQVYWY